MTQHLDDMIAEAERQRDEAAAFLRGLDAERAKRRPAEHRWSAAEHVGHLALTDRPYFAPIEAAIARARSAGRLADGPFRGGRVGNGFARLLDAPPKRRLRTTKRLEPPRDLDCEAVAADFAACRDELIGLMRTARGVDLDRAKISSPFLPVLRMPVSSAFAVLLAHGRRHIWLAREAAGE